MALRSSASEDQVPKYTRAQRARADRAGWPDVPLGEAWDRALVESRAIRKLAGTLIGQPELLSSDSPCWAPKDIQSGLVANPR